MISPFQTEPKRPPDATGVLFDSTYIQSFNKKSVYMMFNLVSSRCCPCRVYGSLGTSVTGDGGKQLQLKHLFIIRLTWR